MGNSNGQWTYKGNQGTSRKWLKNELYDWAKEIIEHSPVDDYIVKPFDMDILIMKIAAILRRAKIENEKEIELDLNLTDVYVI